MEWISVKQSDPPQYSRILATNGKTIHVGVYYEETGKICIESDLRFDVGGMCCSLDEHYTHWMICPEPPKE